MTSSTRPYELSPAHVKRYDVNSTMYRNDVKHTSVRTKPYPCKTL